MTDRIPPTLRPARPSDLEQILIIEGSGPFTPHWTRRQFAEELGAERSRFLVIEERGRVLGYLVQRELRPEVQIINLAVHPQARRQGLGRRLLDHALREARGGGCAKATLELSLANEPGLRLYRGAGFQEVGRRKGFYPDGSDALLMDRRLGG